MQARLLVLLIVALGAASPAYSHGGGLDQNGCHHDRKRGGYHCHRAKQSFITPAPQRPIQQTVPLKQQPSGNAARQSKAERLASDVQRALAALGYYDGPITATVGPRTKAAITEFERAFYLPVTGRITPDLLSRLGIAWP